MSVDLRAIWSQSGEYFCEWFFPIAFLANIVYVRRSTSLSLFIAVLAAVAMTALLTITVPLSLLVSTLLSWAMPVLGARLDSTSGAGLIAILFISVLISSAAQSALLRLFKHRVALPGFWFLFLLNIICLALAFTRTINDGRPAIARSFGNTDRTRGRNQLQKQFARPSIPALPLAPQANHASPYSSHRRNSRCQRSAGA